MSELTKRSKATLYKNQLDKAIDLLKKVQEISDNFDTWGIEQLFEFQDAINDINFEIQQLLEDVEGLR